MKKAVFFDRDGIINRAIIKDGKPYSPKDLSEFEFIEDIKLLVWQLKSAEYLLVILTNQPDISRGLQTKENIETIHRHIMNRLPIDKIYCCFHDNKDNCECRKPRPGMILQAAKEFNIDLKNSWVVGDRIKDVLAGINAGCKTIFVDYEYKETTNNIKDWADHIVKNIKEIEEIIL